MRMRKKLLLATCLVGLALGLGGCRVAGYLLYLVSPSRSSRTIPAEFEGLSGKTVAVLIAVDEALLSEHQYLRLQTASVIGAELEKQIEEVKVVAPQRGVRFQDDNLSWEAMSPAELGRKLGADILLRVNVLDYGLREPGSASLYRGRITGEAEIFDVSRTDDQDAVWRSEAISISFPKEGHPINRISGGARQLRFETDRRFAEALVKKFYKHEVKVKG
jgi:hypothetical protein